MKKSELLPVFPPCDTETGSEQTAPADLLDVGLLQTFNLLKKKKKNAACEKLEELCLSQLHLLDFVWEMDQRDALKTSCRASLFSNVQSECM